MRLYQRGNVMRERISDTSVMAIWSNVINFDKEDLISIMLFIFNGTLKVNQMGYHYRVISRRD